MDTNSYRGVCPAREANPPPGEISLHGRQIADDETRRYCFARLRARSNAGQGEGAGDVSCPLTADLGGNSAWNCCYGGAAAMAMACCGRGRDSCSSGLGLACVCAWICRLRSVWSNSSLGFLTPLIEELVQSY